VPKTAVTISINEEAALDFFASLLEMEVEEDHRLATAFRIRLALTKQGDGLWAFLDDERVQLWNKVKITVNLADEDEELVDGYMTQIKPHLDRDEDKSYLEIIGLDATCLMSVEEKISDWPSKSDSDIAREIFMSYSLPAEVDDTLVIHDEVVSTIIQRETDIQFLKRLARRNGFECFVKGGMGYFRKPVLTDAPQPLLSAHFGGETNLVSFDATVDALRPTTVEMHQIDVIAKELQNVVVESTDQLALGRDAALSVEIPNGITAKMIVKHAPATGQPEMENLSRAQFDEASWFIQGRGEVESTVYGAVLQTRKLVPIKGIGELFSGVYYVTNVRHLFSNGRYTQHFTARRNALAPSGPGDFVGGDSLLGGLI
jgi:phage protein D